MKRSIQWVILAAGLLLVLVAARSWVRRDGDFQLYVGVGEAVLRGGHIYRDLGEGGNTWPPLYAVVCVPIALAARMGPRIVRAGWIALNLWMLFLIMKLLAGAVHGKALALAPRKGALSPASPEILVPLVLAGAFINDNFTYLQVNLVILACVTAGIVWLSQGREVAGGAIIGMAAALKVLPGLFIPWLLWRRRWKAAGAAFVTAAVLSLAPALVFGWGRFWEFVADWPRAAKWGWGVNAPNQSLYAMWDRFAGFGRWGEAVRLPRSFVGPSGDPAVVFLLAVTVAVLLAAMAVAMPPRGEWNRRTVLLEGGAVAAAAVVLGPLGWYHYFVFLLIPLTVLWGFLRQGILPATARRWAPWILAEYALLVFPSSSGLVRFTISTVWLNLSAVTLAALLVIAGSLWVRVCIGEGRGRSGCGDIA